LALAGCEVLFPLAGGGGDDDGADGAIADAAAAPPDGTPGAADAAPDGAPPPPPDAMPNDLCPADYGTFSGRRYRPVLTFLPFAVAAEDCADDRVPGSIYHTHLVVLDDDLERSFVDATFQLVVAWIGLSDIVGEGQWRWVTLQDTMGYPPAWGPWATNQPDDGGNAMNEDCVFIANPGAVLGDADCALGLRYVCECDLFADTPSQYTLP
jgi:hypothetical protein